ncbi:hypothetical protein HAP41_0000048740 (plasmid) [Bradyrhizobium barranii subsp. apii]|uniref:Uncharacterized protein n=1 Tax=Bradyrhizobium barranii subsp. apii TaxID=2819348 RepID=A0A8T5VWZ7_9BRAD|nr:hypothetical protein [Bradyrhizobium barranii]UPT92158.1 hypothetical protein HAP41_0000048740 [Bradyrhizobium barranii subsp. apii]
MSLYTKDGRPLQESGEYIYSGSGVPVGKRRGDKVFGPTAGGDDRSLLQFRFTESPQDGDMRAQSEKFYVRGA